MSYEEKSAGSGVNVGVKTPATSPSTPGVPFPLDDAALQVRSGAPWTGQLLVGSALLATVLILAWIVGDTETWASHRLEVLLTVGGVACWRWGWFVYQNIRAVIYRYWTFPRLRRQATEAVAREGQVPELIVLATTYHEKPWITSAVFHSILSEMKSVKGLSRRPRLIVVTGCDADDANIRKVFVEWCPVDDPEAGELWPPELVLMRGANGKRAALAVGMREVSRTDPDGDGVVVIMDADTVLQPGLMNRTLPIFRLKPSVSAVTTNENGCVRGPGWFAEWISLRFGLRHRTMCSISLSDSLLCLTGRLSAFRASVVTDPRFHAQVERDQIEHWLWGRFDMLSGDDKSTWYWLAANKHRMLYIPDAMVTTIEVIDGPGIPRALANIRRWSGNSVRHCWRAIELGPRTLGWFPWWSLVDQRLAMWTVMFGPVVAILGLAGGHYLVVAGYLLWLLCSRIGHTAIACYHGRRFSAYYIPMLILSDWIAAVTKMWVLFHPAKQAWMNRGARTLDSTKGSAFFAWRSSFAHYMFWVSCVGFLLLVGVFLGFIPVFGEARLFLQPYATHPTNAVERVSVPGVTAPHPSLSRTVPGTPQAEAGDLSALDAATLRISHPESSTRHEHPST